LFTGDDVPLRAVQPASVVTPELPYIAAWHRAPVHTQLDTVRLRW